VVREGSAAVFRFVSFASFVFISSLAIPARAQTGDTLTASTHIQSVVARPTFETSVDLVALTVTVTDNSDHYVRNLGLDDFTVFEDGVAHPVSFFGVSDVPLDLALLIDASASMQSQMAMVRQAASGLLRTLKQGDRASLVEFRDQIAIGQPMTADLARVASALDRITAHGGTSLYNALYVTLRDFQKAAADRSSLDMARDDPEAREGVAVRRRAIVVLSDGADTGSLISFDDLLDLARRVGVTVYTIAIQPHVPLRRESPQPQRRFLSQADRAMRTLAEETGARAFFPTTGFEVKRVYDTIASELASQYAIGYTSRNARRDGAWRRILVRIASRPGVRSRTRTGYFAAGVRVLAAALRD
jgi:Ca-activated chloride channel homolog